MFDPDSLLDEEEPGQSSSFVGNGSDERHEEQHFSHIQADGNGEPLQLADPPSVPKKRVIVCVQPVRLIRRQPQQPNQVGDRLPAGAYIIRRKRLQNPAANGINGSDIPPFKTERFESLAPVSIEEQAEMPSTSTSNFMDPNISANSEEFEEYQKPKGPVRIRCDVCGKVIETVNSFLEHRRRTHGANTMLHCHICRKRFETKNKILLHLNLELKVNQCYICKKLFEGEYTMLSHVESCELLAEANSNIKIKKKHDSNAPIELETTINNVIKANTKVYGCENCPMKFCSSGDLETHQSQCFVDMNHDMYGLQNGEDGMEEFIKNEELSQDGKMLQEMDYGYLFEDLTCFECKYKATDPADLTSHRKYHHFMKEFECSFCHMRMTSYEELNEHHRWEVESRQESLIMDAEREGGGQSDSHYHHY